MIKSIIYIIGFLLGIFIILNIISYKTLIYKYFLKDYESFSIKNKEEDQSKQQSAIKSDMSKSIEENNNVNEKISAVQNCSKDIINDFTIYKLLKKQNLIILISSYIQSNISNTSWKSDNNNKYVSINKSIQKETFALNPVIKGYNIKDVSIKGPEIDEKNKNINAISLLYMMNIKDFQNEYNYLFELKCKPTHFFDTDTKKKHEINNDIYILIKNRDALKLSEINEKCNEDKDCKMIQKKLRENINIHNNYYFYEKENMKKDNEYISTCKKNELCNKNLTFKNELEFFNQLLDTKVYNMEIKIGKDIFHIYNINNSIFKNDMTFIALILNNDIVTIHINNLIYNFNRTKVNDAIIIDSNSFIINENGGCDITLFSFAFFNEAICEYDLSAFKLYNYYYMYGANKIEENNVILTNNNNDLVKKLNS